jgi:hypothetical protein
MKASKHVISALAVFTAAAIVAGMSLFASISHANPLQFVPTTQLATATTSVAYLVSGGSATTTTFDAYAQGQPLAIDKGVLLLQNAASSTSSVLDVSVQYSNDNIDWYSDQLLAPTTTAMDISVANTYHWKATATATTSKAITLSFPTRYVRVVYSASGAAGAIWWQFVPQRQSH